MSNQALTIIKKEFKRFFGDKRLVFSTIIMPGLLIYIIYTLMGSVMGDLFTADENHEAVVYSVNTPASGEAIFSSLGYEYIESELENVDSIKDSIGNKEADVLIVFPDDFDDEVAVYDSMSGDIAPMVEIYFNSANNDSSEVYSYIVAGLDAYESALSNRFDINGDQDVNYDLATAEDTSAMVFGMLIPMLLLMMIVSGCISVAPDAIAGEKERGTMATMLVAPVSRSSIAIGKIVALGFFALLSGLSSSVGIILSIPNMYAELGDGFNLDFLGVKQYAMMLIVVLATVLMVISLVSVISCIAKTVKEATGYITPISIVGMLTGITCGLVKDPSLAMFTIPLYNSGALVYKIIFGSASTAELLITIAVNLVIAGVCVFILTKLFDNEKIMFAK